MNTFRNLPFTKASSGIRILFRTIWSTILQNGNFLKLPFNKWSKTYWQKHTAAFFLQQRQGNRITYGMFALSVLSTIIISWLCVQVYQVNHAALHQPELLVSESMPDFAELESLFGQASQPFRGAKISQHSVALRKETVNWIGVLQDYDDKDMATGLVVKKYQNLCTAASILSAIGKEPGKQRQWSGLAIRYGQKAVDVLEFQQSQRKSNESGKNDASLELQQDINIRILLAMSLNYYQRGDVTVNDLKLQYLQINKAYLFRSGFCRYEILRALDDDEIIELPGYHSLKIT